MLFKTTQIAKISIVAGIIDSNNTLAIHMLAWRYCKIGEDET